MDMWRVGGVSAHSSVVARQGFASAVRPALRLATRLTTKKIWKKARPNAAINIGPLRCSTSCACA